MVRTLQKFVEVPQSQFLPGCGRRRDYAATRCLATVKVPQSQLIAGVSGPFCRHRDMYAQVAAVHGWLADGDEGVVCCSFAAFFGLRPSGR